MTDDRKRREPLIEEIESLNVEDLDVEELERRIELATVIPGDMLWGCGCDGTNCVCNGHTCGCHGDCGTNTCTCNFDCTDCVSHCAGDCIADEIPV